MFENETKSNDFITSTHYLFRFPVKPAYMSKKKKFTKNQFEK